MVCLYVGFVIYKRDGVGFTVGFLVNQMGWSWVLIIVCRYYAPKYIHRPAYSDLVMQPSLPFHFEHDRRIFLKQVAEPDADHFTVYFLIGIVSGYFGCLCCCI